jgi:hypothetical protein
VTSTGSRCGCSGCHLDITERKRADEERQAHVWFLESMDRVNRAIQGASDLDQMMGDVLEATLAIFDCDRAYLVHPCDPDAAAGACWPSAPAPSTAAAGATRGVAMTAEYVHRFRTLRAADGPCASVPGRAPAAAGVSRFGVLSAVMMVVYPHADQPYAFGLHQCSHARVWSRDEVRLLQEIGRRLADGLNQPLRGAQPARERGGASGRSSTTPPTRSSCTSGTGPFST